MGCRWHARPPQGVVAQVQAKKVQVAKENKSAVKIQANIRGKSEDRGGGQEAGEKENNAATRI